MTYDPSNSIITRLKSHLEFSKFIAHKFLICLSIAGILLHSIGSKADVFNGLEIQAGLSFPTQVGARLRTNFQSSFYATGGFGYLPGFLSQTGHSLMSTLGFVGEKTGVVLADGLADAFVIDFRLGRSFSGELGWFGELGYQFFTNGGGETNTRDIEDSLGSNFTNTFSSFDRADIFVDLHCLAFYVGYSWQIGDHLILTADGGLIKPISNSISTKYNSTSFFIEEIDREFKDHLEDTLKSTYFIPAIEAWISYEFSS